MNTTAQIASDDIISTEFGDVILTGGSDVWYAYENKSVAYIGKKAKRISDGMSCLVNLTKKPETYKYDIVFY